LIERRTTIRQWNELSEAAAAYKAALAEPVDLSEIQQDIADIKQEMADTAEALDPGEPEE
jgi:hypothetical protein